MLNCTISSQEVAVEDAATNQKIILSREDVTNFFHTFYYINFSNHSGPQMQYNGVPIHKHPADMFNYQQIIFQQQPEFIIECGAFQGGATLYFANLLDLIGKGRVISVDICEREGVWHEKVRQHPRVTCIAGSSTAQEIVAAVKEQVGDCRNNFIILDSLHTKEHVLQEMKAYSPLVSSGNYMIVEDSNLNGHPLPASLHPQTATGGPFEAVEEFMRESDDFVIDTGMENRFLFSFAPSGYLVKK